MLTSRSRVDISRPLGRGFYFLAFGLFASLGLAFGWNELAKPVELTFSNDAASYNSGALHLSRSLFYSLDGVTPYAEREPGLSFFYALIYRLFGEQNRAALFAMQWFLFFAALAAFVHNLTGILAASERGALLMVMSFLPSAMHTHLLPLRESLTLSMMLIAATFYLKILRAPTRTIAFGLGIVWGLISLTYLPFLFFPLVVFLLARRENVPWRRVVVIPLVSALMAFGWMARNQVQTGRFELTSNWRTTAILYSRSVQAKDVRGLEPFRCLVAEYVTRDWRGLSESCSINSVANRKWPDRKPSAEDDAVREESVRTIIELWPHYLWFSAFEVLEFHLPFIGGRGFSFNLLVAGGIGLVYLGCALAPFGGWRRPIYRYVLALILYSSAMFAVFDATPRYRMPILFCYAVPSSVGLCWVWRRIRRSLFGDQPSTGT